MQTDARPLAKHLFNILQSCGLKLCPVHNQGQLQMPSPRQMPPNPACLPAAAAAIGWQLLGCHVPLPCGTCVIDSVL